MQIRRCARVSFLVLMAPLLAFTTACDPGSLLGISGDNGSSTYTPDYSKAPPAHQASLPCKDSDPTHLCVALNYVVYDGNASQPLISQSQAASNVQDINSVWAQCHVQFYLENFTAANPANYKLPEDPSSSDDLTAVRTAFTDNARLTVVTTGQWTGDLGAQPANGWTEMPAIGPFGTVIEQSVATISNLIAHELGHYLNLVHVADEYDVMNPVVYANSLNLTDDQCSEARATAISFWGAMLR